MQQYFNIKNLTQISSNSENKTTKTDLKRSFKKDRVNNCIHVWLKASCFRLTKQQKINKSNHMHWAEFVICLTEGMAVKKYGQ